MENGIFNIIHNWNCLSRNKHWLQGDQASGLTNEPYTKYLPIVQKLIAMTEEEIIQYTRQARLLTLVGGWWCQAFCMSSAWYYFVIVHVTHCQPFMRLLQVANCWTQQYCFCTERISKRPEECKDLWKHTSLKSCQATACPGSNWKEVKFLSRCKDAITCFNNHCLWVLHFVENGALWTWAAFTSNITLILQFPVHL